MRWKSGRRSTNVEDRRGRRASPGAAGIGCGTLVILLIAVYFGVDPSTLLDTVNEATPPPSTTEAWVPSAEEQELADFVTVVLADTEDTWHAIFNQAGGVYREPTLVLFTGAVRSACGFAQAAMGPFYCPADSKLYIDLSFYDELRRRFRAPGDFAQAYVIAHEVGHHVQNLLGLTTDVQRAQQQARSQAEANELSVRLELQADCFAGVWANHAERSRQVLEQGDLEEGLNAAAAIGDDRLQRQGQGYVVPESFTHGSSEQRVRWFRIGLENGDLRTCNTFETRQL